MKPFLWGLGLGAALALAGCLWWHHEPPPPPLTEPEREALGDAGFDPADEGVIEDATPELPGTPAGTVTVTMRPRRPRPPGNPAATDGAGKSGGNPSEPGRDRINPPSLVEPPAPAPIQPGLTTDDLWGSSNVTIRQAGSDLWTRADLTCCAGDLCRSEVGAETEARFDRPALCGRPRLARLWTVGLGVAAPDPEIVVPVAFWGEGRRLGYYGAARYSLDPGVTETDRLRVEAGVVLRIGR